MNKSAERLELNKILEAAASYCVLEGSRAALVKFEPVKTLAEARTLLDATEEASILLFTLGSGSVEYFPPLGDKAERAAKGATLSCSELTDVGSLLRSARVVYRSVNAVSDERIQKIKILTDKLHFHENLEEDIRKKINGEELNDDASEKLFSLRREIRSMQERIRSRLAEYLTGEERRYLQEGLVTVRGDRFVIPVKAEYKRSIKGFVHDRSQSGATVFIEPEEVLGMNNDLVTLMLDEKEEEERILSELSRAVGVLSASLQEDVALLEELDGYFARAEYGYRTASVKPILNGKGILEIVRGRHPLLGKSAVPVTVSVGGDYDFLVISGANAGGKTVTLKMCGLFCLMGACGLFVPAAEGTKLPVFSEVFCDLGDSQSIEENLSTFSSHIVNLKEILERADATDFALIDEPGGGTDPEEGQALACAAVESLLKRGCRGIVTTHFFSLKEFAFGHARIKNACMEFDAESRRPLYKLNIGTPGSSNALSVCEKLGLPQETLELAREYLSEGARTYDETVRAAEKSRLRAEETTREAMRLKEEWTQKAEKLRLAEEKFARERERFLANAKAEAKRIVAERTERAEELISEIEEIFKREEKSESDLIRARTLKNKIGEVAIEEHEVHREPVEAENLKEGDRVYVASLECEGVVLSVKKDKGVAEIRAGSMRVQAALKDLYVAAPVRKQEDARVQVVRRLQDKPFRAECNLIGMTVLEGIAELENFLDAALLHNAEEVRIVHGMGTGKLRSAVRDFLKKHPRVKSFRLGQYGEGQTGVTIVTLK